MNITATANPLFRKSHSTLGFVCVSRVPAAVPASGEVRKKFSIRHLQQNPVPVDTGSFPSCARGR
jgi:hypothetical protein